MATTKINYRPNIILPNHTPKYPIIRDSPKSFWGTIEELIKRAEEEKKAQRMKMEMKRKVWYSKPVPDPDPPAPPPSSVVSEAQKLLDFVNAL